MCYFVVAFWLSAACYIVDGITVDIFPIPNDANGEEFQELAVSGQHVFAATERTLYQLSADLTEIERKNVLPFTRLLLASNNSAQDDEVLLICGRNCGIVGTNSIRNGIWPVNRDDGVPEVLDESSDGRGVEITGIMRRGDGPGRFGLTYAQNSFIDTTVMGNDEQVASRIIRGIFRRAAREDPIGRSDSFETVASQIEQNPAQDREFIYAFSRNGFEYFVSVMSFESSVETRIARVCDSDEGEGGNFTSYIELALQCSNSNSQPTAATFIPAPNAFDGDTLVVSVSVQRLSEIRNNVCAFDVSVIDEMMADKINECANGIGMLGLVRDTASRTQCVVMTMVSFQTSIAIY